MRTKSNDLMMQNRVFFWIALATGLILLIPALAMQFTGAVNWTLLDFATAGVLLFGMGSLFVLAARRVHRKYRVPVGIAFAAALLYIWAELAVGVFTSWGS